MPPGRPVHGALDTGGISAKSATLATPVVSNPFRQTE